MDTNQIQQALTNPLPRKGIEFRVCRASAKNKSVNVLPYLTARGVMQRLDEVFGIEGWEDSYEVLSDGVKCKLSVNIGGEWIAKEDVASFTNIEALKGAFSDSLKRAGVKFGIGRYLYDLSGSWVDILPDKPYNAINPVHYYRSGECSGYWVEPDIPHWALPGNVTPNCSRQDSISDEHLAKLQQLLEAELITKGKYSQFAKTLSQSDIPKPTKDLIASVLNLIELYGKNIRANKNISQADKRDLYKRILSCKQADIKVLEEQILSVKQKEAA